MVGFLLQWPTLPTLVMFPILLAVYRRLTIREEREIAAAFGAEWDTYLPYAARTHRFEARFRRTNGVVPTNPGRGSRPVGTPPH